MQNKFANWIIKNGQWQLIVTKNWILNCIYYDFYHFCSQFKIKTNLNILLWTWFYRDVTMNESMLKRRRRFCWSFFINFAALAVGIVAEKSAKSETNNATVNSNSNVCVWWWWWSIHCDNSSPRLNICRERHLVSFYRHCVL